MCEVEVTVLGRDPDPVLRELREQTRWLRLLVIQNLRPQLASALPTESQRQVYALSDGVRTTREIATAAGVGAATVSRWWAQWVRQGLMVASETYNGRWGHLATIEEIGLGAVIDRQAETE